MPEDISSDTGTATIDVESMSDRIGASLGEELIGRQTEPSETPGVQEAPSPKEQAAPPTQSVPQAYEVPKSWKKDMHEKWGGIAPEAQAYIIEREKQLLDGFSTFKPIQDAISPHLEFLNRANIPVARAVASLLQAQRRLTEGTLDQRKAAYRELGQNLQLLEEAAQAQPAIQVDPAIQSVQTKLQAIEQQLASERQAQMDRVHAENQKLVDAFWSDTKAHPYVEEVADDMAIFIRQGSSLQEAYDKAVRTNEAVYAKEQARLLTEAEAKWKEKARLDALPKRKAASVNLKSSGDGPEPTEPVGSLNDTIRSGLKAIRARS